MINSAHAEFLLCKLSWGKGREGSELMATMPGNILGTEEVHLTTRCQIQILFSASIKLSTATEHFFSVLI